MWIPTGNVYSSSTAIMKAGEGSLAKITDSSMAKQYMRGFSFRLTT